MLGLRNEKAFVRATVPAVLMTIGLVAASSFNAAAQGTRGSAGGSQGFIQTAPAPAIPVVNPQSMNALPTVGAGFGGQPGSAGQIRGSGQPVGLIDTQTITTSTGVNMQPILAGTAGGAGLPLVSEDFTTFSLNGLGLQDGTNSLSSAGAQQATATQRSGPPVSSINVPGSQFNSVSSAGAAPLPTLGSRPSGPPVSRLNVESALGIDYSKLSSEFNATPTARSTARTTTPARATPTPAPSQPAARPQLPTLSTAQPAAPSTPSSNILSLANSNNGGSTAPAARPAITGLQLPVPGQTTNVDVPALPSVSLPSAPQTASTGDANSGLTLSLPSAQVPSDFQIVGYQGDDTAVPTSSRGTLGSLAAAMRANTDITVDLISYSQEANGKKAKALSGKRAVEVRRLLIEQGVASGRISVSARGDSNGTVSDNRINVQVAG